MRTVDSNIIVKHKNADLEILEKLTDKSQITEKDTIKLGELIKISAAKKLGFM